MPREEYLPILNENHEVSGKAPRSEFHFNPSGKLLHPVVHLHLINEKNEIYLQLRPMDKLIQPGKWDTAVGGHVSYGEEIETALGRETEEEIGISADGAEKVLTYTWETEAEKEWVYVFVLKSSIIPVINSNEVEMGKFWGIKEIKENEYKGIFTPNFIHEFQMLTENGIIRTAN